MSRALNILSIQSHVAFGHVGNSSAVFPMQRLGCEVWPVNTVQFSNHPGHGAWKGQVFDGAAVQSIVDGIAALGVMQTCDGVLSGYIGAADIGTAILNAVQQAKAANPQAMWCCDPVIGDVGKGVFVRPGVPEFFQGKALGAVDILTPNQFELDYLSGGASNTLTSARAALAGLHARGPKVILVTSLMTDETPAGSLDMLASDGEALYRLRSPRLAQSFNGAGDAIAALFFVHFLRTKSAADALGHAASSIFGVLRRTMDAGSREILTVAAQDEFVAPSHRLVAQRI